MNGRKFASVIVFGRQSLWPLRLGLQVARSFKSTYLAADVVAAVLRLDRAVAAGAVPGDARVRSLEPPSRVLAGCAGRRGGRRHPLVPGRRVEAWLLGLLRLLVKVLVGLQRLRLRFAEQERRWHWPHHGYLLWRRREGPCYNYVIGRWGRRWVVAWGRRPPGHSPRRVRAAAAWGCRTHC